jgi:predicted transcriptional regulator
LGIYRGRLEIIADILKVVSQNAKKTQIMYKANLSYKVLQKYLRDISEASLISFETARQCYVLTPKGYEFLKAYKNYSIISKSLEKCLKNICSKKKSLEELCENE